MSEVKIVTMRALIPCQVSGKAEKKKSKAKKQIIRKRLKVGDTYDFREFEADRLNPEHWEPVKKAKAAPKSKKDAANKSEGGH